MRIELFPLGTAIALCVFALLWLAVAVVVRRKSNAVDDGATGYTLISAPEQLTSGGPGPTHTAAAAAAGTLREPLLRDDDDEPPPEPPAMERQFTFSPKRAGGGDPQGGDAAKQYLVKSRVPLATRQALFYAQAIFHAGRAVYLAASASVAAAPSTPAGWTAELAAQLLHAASWVLATRADAAGFKTGARPREPLPLRARGRGRGARRRWPGRAGGAATARALTSDSKRWAAGTRATRRSSRFRRARRARRRACRAQPPPRTAEDEVELHEIVGAGSASAIARS